MELLYAHNTKFSISNSIPFAEQQIDLFLLANENSYEAILWASLEIVEI